MSGILWPVLLITFGVLILLSEVNIRPIGNTLPLMFIVAGVVMVLQHTASTEGHLDNQQPQAGGQLPPQDPTAGNQGVNNV